jgi:hypothetical protein
VAALGVCGLRVGGAQESRLAASFEEALAQARSYPVQYQDPASVQKGLSLYAFALRNFPDDPRVPDAKMGIFEILRVEGSPSNLRRAADIIKELVAQADVRTVGGGHLALRFVDFHIEEGMGMPFQDLNESERWLDRIARIAGSEDHSLLGLKVAARIARIRVFQGREVDALTGSLAALSNAMGWARSGFWVELYEKDRSGYEQYVVEIQNIASAAAWAIDRSRDPAVAGMLWRERVLLEKFEVLRSVRNRFEERVLLGEPGAFAKFERELLASVDSMPTEPLTSLPQPAKGAPGSSSVAAPTGRGHGPAPEASSSSSSQRRRWVPAGTAWIAGGIFAAVCFCIAALARRTRQG